MVSLRTKIATTSIVILAALLLWKGLQRPPIEVPPKSEPLHENGPAAPAKTAAISNPVAIPPRQPANSDTPQSLATWLTPFKSKNGLNVRAGADGQVTVVSGFKYPSNWKSAEDGLNFAKTFANHLNIPGEQVIVSPNPAPPETDVTEVFRYSQVVAGFPVFSAYLQITQSRSTGDSYLMINELKELGTPDLSNNYSISQIEEILKSKFGTTAELSPEKNAQQIYSTSRGKAELTWAYSVEIFRPGRDRRFVLVSAKDGNILLDQSLVVH